MHPETPAEAVSEPWVPSDGLMSENVWKKNNKKIEIKSEVDRVE